jgi:3-deoxy-D-manno-octulosonic-acid transferase
MDLFKGDSLCLVCGSSWPEDEEVLLPFLNSELGQSIKTVIAPHKIDQKKITELETKLQVPLVVYSKKDHELLSQAQVLIIDTVGLLTKIYSYADIAYVGGAMGSTGLHNILEPATFGVPVVIGKNFDNFPEAQKLEDIAGLFSVSTPEESEEILSKLVTDKQFREKTGIICGHFVNSNTGATRAILDYLKNYLPN